MKILFFLLYLFFLFFVTIFSYAFIDPGLIFLKPLFTGIAFDFRLPIAAIYIGIIIIFFVFYLLFIYFYNRKYLTQKNLYFLIALSMITLVFAYPAMLSFDIFNYIATAKIYLFYKENPYIVMPIEFLHDPLLLFMHAGNKTALYGPVWIVLTAIPYVLGLSNFLLIILNFKIFIAGFFVGTLIVLKKLIKDNKVLLLFGLNPLVLIETFLSGHNDIVMVFLFLTSFLLLKNKKLFLAIIFFITSILIKYSSLFLLPIFIYLLFKTFNNQKINWERIFLFSWALMLIIFLLSFLREEIYPWYALWFLPFGFILHKNRFLSFLCTAFSFGLLLRYVPFILTGTYFGYTPIIKTLVTFVPVTLLCFYFLVRKLWSSK